MQTRRERMLVDVGNDIKMTVAEVIAYYNVRDCTDIEYDEMDLEIMDRGLEALFDKISKKPGNVSVVILPSDECCILEALKFDVYVDMVGVCVGKEAHITKAREHLMAHDGVDAATYVVFREAGEDLVMKAYVPEEVHYMSFIRVELGTVSSKSHLNAYAKLAPLHKRVVVPGIGKRKRAVE